AVRTRARATPGGARPAREGYGGCAPRSGRPAFSTRGYRVRACGGLAESPGRPTGRARGGRLPGHVDEHVDVLPLETCTRCGGAVGTERVEVQSQPPGGSKGTAAAAVSVAPPPSLHSCSGPANC